MMSDLRVSPNAHIYIDGIKRRIIRLDHAAHGVAVVCDSPEHPSEPTHSYNITHSAIVALHSGGAVRTCGHLFSLRAPASQTTIVKRIEMRKPPAPPTFRQRVARVLHRFADTIGGSS